MEFWVLVLQAKMQAHELEELQQFKADADAAQHTWVRA